MGYGVSVGTYEGVRCGVRRMRFEVVRQGNHRTHMVAESACPYAKKVKLSAGDQTHPFTCELTLSSHFHVAF